MSYSHAEGIARIAAREIAAAADTPPVDPRLYGRDDMRRILAKRDIGGLFRVLKDAGLTQRTIAELVGMVQSEVSEILKDRRVIAYDVLLRSSYAPQLGSRVGRHARSVPPRSSTAGSPRYRQLNRSPRGSARLWRSCIP